MPWSRWMIAFALVSPLLVGCAPRPAAGGVQVPRAAGARSVRANARSAALEHAAFELVNRHRRARGLAPLALDPRISRRARLHSADMAAGRMPLGHDGFADRATALRQVFVAYRGTAENVAFNPGHRDPAAEAVRGWLASRKHRENIEGPYELTGVGVVSNAAGEVYCTQIFVGR